MTRNLPVDAAASPRISMRWRRSPSPTGPGPAARLRRLFLEGRAYLDERMQAAGLETHIDAGGNLIGRRAGNKPGLGTIMVGSHSDTVPDGGRFDGIAGVSRRSKWRAR